MAKFENLLRFIWHLSEAHDIKKDPVLRASCKKYGIMSIVYAIMAVPLALLAVCAIGWMNGKGALLFIFVIAALLIGAVGALIMLFNAIAYWFLQLSVNRRPVTWISLVILLASIVGAVFIVMTFLG